MAHSSFAHSSWSCYGLELSLFCNSNTRRLVWFTRRDLTRRDAIRVTWLIQNWSLTLKIAFNRLVVVDSGLGCRYAAGDGHSPLSNVRIFHSRNIWIASTFTFKFFYMTWRAHWENLQKGCRFSSFKSLALCPNPIFHSPRIDRVNQRLQILLVRLLDGDEIG